MAKKDAGCCREQFKTMIGGQALIEGIMLRGPELDALVVRTPEGIVTETTPRKIAKKGSWKTWPLIRGLIGFGGSMVAGVKALMRSADLAMDVEEAEEEEPSKLDQWLSERLSNEKAQQVVIYIAVAVSLCFSIGLFFLLPMIVGSFLGNWIENVFLVHLCEGVVRIALFVGYLFLCSRMKEMRRVFSYHGAEHKTIRCYEAKLPLTVENVRKQTRLHPRCGTSFLFVVMILSILVFSVASSGLLAVFPQLAALKETSKLVYSLIMMGFKLLLLPLIVAIGYEINRVVGRHDNWLTRILTAPGMWFQYFTTNEPDDSMIEVGIQALTAVLPREEGADQW